LQRKFLICLLGSEFLVLLLGCKMLFETLFTQPQLGCCCMAIVSVSAYLTMSDRAATLFYRCILIMLYGNLIGYQTAPFTNNRGLAPHDGFMNILCYFSFYSAALAALLLVGMAIFAANKTLKY